MMKVEAVRIRTIELPLKKPFITHQASFDRRKLLIVEAEDPEGRIGYGEVTAFESPFYTSETIVTAFHVLKEFLIPLLFGLEEQTPAAFAEGVRPIQGHPMAKAGLEGALWDLYGKKENKSLKKLLGGIRESVKAGAVLSLTDNLREEVEALKLEGYERYKLKVRKGCEKETIEALRKIAPDLPVMIDANGQYGPDDFHRLQEMDEYGLMMIEQPFQPADFFYHKELQATMRTPLCLDESIMSFHDAVQGVELESCRIVNVKISRVGGLTEAKAIHDFCERRGVPVWCGGMVESGVSKAHNLALATLPNFTIPGDLSSSTRYFERDIVQPPIIMDRGEIRVPEGPGIGIDVDREYLEFVTNHSYEAKAT
ncbi:o-succinylbenzoate synthase [Bacillus sp. SB49]|uniref:o-succinylbenzoate synthase n=1 Tax=Bacillus sp. SB49 TaxID=1071080 RepID=UPI00041E5FFD|nr:o-succinylbenzoate synthase [Bacillus sp. SB49]